MAAQAKARLPEHSPGSKQLLNFWIFQRTYCRKVCSEIWWKSHSINNGLPDIGLASCLWVQNNLVAKSRRFSPVKQAFWTNMWQVVRGRKASLVTNSVVYNLILRWISNKCCCYLEISGLESTWKVSTVPNQQLSSGCYLCFCVFLLFLYMSIPNLSLFSVPPDFRLL